MKPMIPVSTGAIVWVDYRVFWADMPYIALREEDNFLLQTTVQSMPEKLWVKCIELTFNGADPRDTCLVFDQLFDNYITHARVLEAVKKANADLYKIMSLPD